MNLLQLGAIIQSTQQVILFMREHGLLAETIQCCGHDCTLMNDNGSDGEIFRCQVCRKKKSIRTGSFFSRSMLQLRHLLCLLYFFANGASVTETRRYLKDMVGKNSIMQWFTYLREICSESLLKKDEIILGEGDNSIVQIDECFMGGKLKYHRGNPQGRGSQQVIFGMIDTQTKKCVVNIVPNRKKETLIPIIQKHVTPGATIYSDEAATYKCLRQKGFVHRTVKHKTEFKSATGVHTNIIENLWSNLKYINKKRKGMARQIVPLVLDEFLYRWNRKLDGEMFTLFIEDIARYYPVH